VWEEIAETDGVPLKPGLLELLSLLDELKLPRAIATSNWRNNVEKLLPETLLSRFDAIISCEDVVRHKPAPDAIIAAAASIGVESGNLLVLDDTGPGIKAAVAAGALAIQIPDMKGMIPDGNADLVFGDLLQVRDLLANRNGKH
jgi:HAD superfamily hydrolase (TIGR01509 family)